MPEEQSQPGVWVDPYRAYNFKLEIQGVTQGHFTRCEGLGIQVEAIKYREGGLNQIVHRIPGRVEYDDVNLYYGLTSSIECWQWFMKAVEGKVERKNISIVMVDNDGSTRRMQWDLIDCWPAAWRGAPLDAMCNEIAVEYLTLVYGSLKRG